METSIQPYAETVEQEVAATLRDLQMSVILRHVYDTNGDIPQELRNGLQSMVLGLNDLFSTSIPVVDDDPEDAIRRAGRDLRFALLLRERGIARVVRLAMELSKDGTPLYKVFRNTNDGSEFFSQEDFLKWFCGEFKVARSLVFMRKGTYEKLMGLGLSMEQSFDQIIKRPYLVREALLLDKNATWDNGRLVDIEPSVAREIGKLLPQEQADQIAVLAQAYQDTGTDDDRDALCAAMKPAMLALVDHVSGHESARGARELINVDVLGKPEVSYKLDPVSGVLTLELVEKGVDREGNEYIANIREVAFLPDAPEVPKAMLRDLMERLPVRGKNSMVI